MSESGKAPLARVVLCHGGVEAELVLHADEQGNSSPAELCCALAAEAGIRLSPQTVAAIKDACAGLEPGGQRRVVIARGSPPVHGTDGVCRWDVQHHAAATEAADASHTDTTDHYERSRLILVKNGQILGTLVAPTEGVDGLDVTGRSLAARHGKPSRLIVDESIMIDGEGRLIAQRDGVLSRSGDRASVRDLLQIPDFVDFSTGHIDFPGDVEVAKGVRDLFHVRSRGNLVVRGLIESTTIDVGGDLSAPGGLAGRGQGVLRVHGDAAVRYIAGYTARINGNLEFDRELIDSTIDVSGSVRSAGGSIIGGSLTAVARIEVATIGSPAGVPTRLVLGSVPTLEPRLLELESLIGRLSEEVQALERELKPLSTPGRRLTPSDKERSTELTFALQKDLARLGQAEQARQRVRQIIAGLSTVSLEVHSEIHQGVVIAAEGREFHIRDRLKGPILVSRSSNHEIVLRRSDGAASPLSKWSNLRAAA